MQEATLDRAPSAVSELSGHAAQSLEVLKLSVELTDSVNRTEGLLTSCSSSAVGPLRHTALPLPSTASPLATAPSPWLDSRFNPGARVECVVSWFSLAVLFHFQRASGLVVSVATRRQLAGLQVLLTTQQERTCLFGSVSREISRSN